jgi:hypothetical protein
MVIGNGRRYAAFLFLIGIIGLFAFGFSFAIFYMKRKGINAMQLFKFTKMT